jgi:hypothetical protein
MTPDSKSDHTEGPDNQAKMLREAGSKCCDLFKFHELWDSELSQSV